MTRLLGRTLLAAGVLLASGCATIWTPRAALPDRHTLVRGQLVLYSDFPLPVHHRLLDDLSAQRTDLGRRLDLPGSDEPIHVYLFDGVEHFRRFMRQEHPGFPDRRAFFVESDARLAVYARWGDRMAEDLRHEVTHGYLHSAVPNLPLWLDEGLAEYFEVARGRRGLNREHLDRLRLRIERAGWQPDLERLERLDPEADLNQDDYAESWAWAHFLLESRVEYADLLRDYLADLRRDGTAEPLWLRLRHAVGRSEWLLIEHVRGLEKR